MHHVAKLLLIFLLVSSTHAEIFVDFALSQGGTSLGTLRAELYYEEVPRVATNFIALAMGQRPWLDPVSHQLKTGVPFYDGLIFHRLVHDFIIQGGDPTGIGSGGPGYVFQDEFHPSRRHSEPYVLSMAHAGANTNGSQFFITLRATPELDDFHSVFGRIISGHGLLESLRNPALFPTNAQDRPLQPVVMDSVTVSGSGLDAFMAGAASRGLPTWKPVNAEVKARTEEGELAVSLVWDRRERWEYPAVRSVDLVEWESLGKLISLNDASGYTVDVAGSVGDAVFLQVLGLDYSGMAKVPPQISVAGARLTLALATGGELRFQFNGTGGGTWTHFDGGLVVDSGTLTLVAEDTMPPEGAFVAEEGTLAPLLLVRQMRFGFNKGIGPSGFTMITPTLSFHDANGGWYNMASVEGNSVPAGLTLRGSFSIVMP